MYPDCVSSLSEKTETDRYSPFVILTKDALEKLQDLDIPGLKRAPEGPERIIFLVSHPNEVLIQSGSVASHYKPEVVIMRLSDTSRAYSGSLLVKEWAQTHSWRISRRVAVLNHGTFARFSLASSSR